MQKLGVRSLRDGKGKKTSRGRPPGRNLGTGSVLPARPPHSLFVRHAKIRILLCFFSRSETRRAGSRTKHNGANGTTCFFALDSGPANLPFDFTMIGIWGGGWTNVVVVWRTDSTPDGDSISVATVIIHTLSLGSNLQARKECSKGARVRLGRI